MMALPNTYKPLKEQKGPYLDPKVKFIAERKDLDIERKPIGDYAKQLVDDYLERDAFFTAIYRFGTSVERAGVMFLGVKKRQSVTIHGQLLEAGSPHEWFKNKAREGFLSKRIGPGRETKRCEYADQFFGLLVGEDRSAIYTQAFGGRSQVTVSEADDEVKGLDVLIRQHIGYAVFSSLTCDRRAS